jgi:7-cyano-7-deazaguanine reductase
MTDYSDAASARTEIPEDYTFDTIPAREHRPIIDWVYPEFQSLCPVSNRHDQGTVKIRYKPQDNLLESKSVREYLMLWRNKQNWQEYIAEEIASALFKAIEPLWLVVEIEWAPRGGIFAKTVSRRGDISKIDK